MQNSSDPFVAGRLPLAVSAIHGDKAQREREKALQSFRDDHTQAEIEQNARPPKDKAHVCKLGLYVYTLIHLGVCLSFGSAKVVVIWLEEDTAIWAGAVRSRGVRWELARPHSAKCAVHVNCYCNNT